MKKCLLILAVLILAACTALGALACSNVNQINFISVVARDYERFSYTVYEKGEADDMTPIGTFVYTFHRLQNADGGEIVYPINGKEYTLTSGGVIDTQLTVTAGKYAGENVHATVLFQNAYSPIASYKVYNAYSDGAADTQRSYTSEIDYTAKKTISMNVNGREQSFKKPGYCYDNDTLYSLARGSDITRSSYTLSVAGVDNLQGGTRTVGMGLMSKTVSLTIPCMGEEPQSTVCVVLTAGAQYGVGTSAYIYFVPSYTHVDSQNRTVDLNKVPVRMDEGNYIYLLDAISTEE